LRSLGAVPLKRSAYLLPDTPERYEDLQWLAQEIERDGGEATLIRVHQIDNVRPAEVLRLFHEPRDQDYKQLAARHRKVLQEPDKAKSDTAQTRIQEDHEAAPRLDLTKLRGRRWLTRPRRACAELRDGKYLYAAATGFAYDVVAPKGQRVDPPRLARVVDPDRPRRRHRRPPPHAGRRSPRAVYEDRA
jgi:hypothetical protein